MVPSAVKLLQTLGLYKYAKTLKDTAVSLTPSYRRHVAEMKDFYSGFAGKGSLCFDIGANVGNRTEIFLAIGARVIAVEPQSACIAELKRKFGDNEAFVIVPAALGETEGSAEIHISDASTISSLSDEWIDRVKESGRFSDYDWNKTETIPITTFDALIDKYGVPDFCKIDVEGYEYEVLKGLSQPVGAVSFEFTPEFLVPAVNSIQKLDSLGKAEFNYSIGESMTLVLKSWVDAGTIIATLESLPDKTVFGDVYARFVRGRGR